MNIADFERNPAAAPALIPAAANGVDSSTAVVVELGDNVGPSGEDLVSFRRVYHALLDAFDERKSLTCTSTFWRRPAVDQILKDECVSHGGKYVFIGDLYTDPANNDPITNIYKHPGVAAHPQNWSMAHIAIRVSNVIFHP